MIIKLDGNELKSKRIIHDYLLKHLDLPDYYGCNLDALYDVLSTYEDEVQFILYNKTQLFKHLGQYGVAFLRTFEDAQKVNQNIVLRIDEDK